VPAPTQHESGPLLRRLVLVREGEMGALLWSAAYFFFVLTSYYIMRPVREAMGISRGADKLPWLMTGTLIAMVAVNPVFAALVARLPRRVFIPWTYRFFALNLILFFVVARLAPDFHALGYIFYIWVSVFNLFAVSVFWAFMADGFTTEQSRRLFGFIGIGGTLGTIVGGLVTAGLVSAVGPFGLLLFSAALLEAAAQCVRKLVTIFGLSAGHAALRTPEPGPGMFAGATLIAGSRYLQLICVYLFLYTTLSTFLYIQQGQVIEEAVPDKESRTTVFAWMDIATNTLTLLTQVFLTSRIIRGLGVGLTLAILPALSVAGFAALWAAPAMGWSMLGTVIVFQVARRGVHYAVSRPTREILFTVLGQDEKYKSKPFIDTFVYRAGDLFGAWSPKAIGAGAARWGLSPLAAVPAVAIPLALVSLVAGVVLGGMQRRKAALRDAEAKVEVG
jgi:ATP:ADP antiporter, AAA family